METLKRRSQTRRDFARKMAVTAMGLPLMGSFIPTSIVPISMPSAPATIPGSDSGSWKIHLFSKHLQFLGYDEMAKACVEAGLDGVDLTVRPGGHVLPENVERDLPLAANAIHKAGLELTLMTTRISDPDDPLTASILKVASGLGVKFYRMGYYKYDPDLTISGNIESFRSKMDRLANLNEKYGIYGAYQNHAGERFGAPLWDLWQAVQHLDPNWIGCQYDFRHAVVEGAQSWPLGLELLKDYIRCLAVKDFHWSREDGNWHIKNVPLGEGMLDYKAFFSKAQDLGISGPISLHLEYPLFPEDKITTSRKREMAVSAIRNDVITLKDLLPSDI